ncbi:MAG: efflux RND transporter periplasmic adaptor subunit [Endomicrobium sp.]|jgi:macrolide-specific efflux system membrane fusion protein|uniref:efflux RND transporter periplasmic adaptor subunit n=1 Tax=Candidatus Endomicrobiellum cubanum TaxID=3242325 RepID=UPI00281BEEBA|nr:efflux RND transporter periplasmic adaptor subunit [Endomicrobium sp.]MDR2395082.1 efflux RND transporter periplasmic adaptor subunit [Endomicrobium sp.]
MKKTFLILGILSVAILVFATLRPSVHKIEIQEKLQSRELYVEFRETGWVTPRNRLEIKSPFAGRIEKILVNEGDEIKKGQIIIWMSSSERAAMIDAARAISDEEYVRWQEIYKPTPIVAPMSGFIIYRQKEPGQTVTASDGILVMADDLIINAQIDETDLRYISIGKKLSMYLDAYPQELFEGVIEHISYESRIISNVTVYEIRIKPISKPKVFRSGMTATITISAESKSNAKSISDSFITEKDGKKTVIVNTGSGKKLVFETKEVTTGVTDGKYTEIISGLNDTDTVVILRQQKKAKTKSLMRNK